MPKNNELTNQLDLTLIKEFPFVITENEINNQVGTNNIQNKEMK